MTEKRSSYHHGDLRSAMIQASDALISEGGIEGFSLRTAAQRAGVSPGAPAYHFKNATGLLTEVVLLAYQRLGHALAEVVSTQDPATDVRALSRAYIRFAVEHPGHFRLMYRNDLINRDDPRYYPTASAAMHPLQDGIAAYQGKSGLDLSKFDDAADIFLALSTVHGLAQIMLAEKARPFFNPPTLQDFLDQDLPRLLEKLYP